jgi:hypothetical protein
VGNGTSAVADSLTPVNSSDIVSAAPTEIGPGAPLAWYSTPFLDMAKGALQAVGDAPIYACRAWVTFSNVAISGTYTQSGTTVTVTITAHGMAAGDYVYLDFTSGAGIDGYFLIFNVMPNSFSVTAGNSQTTSGNVTRMIYTIAQGNVSSVSVLAGGVHRIAFEVALPDARYAWSGSAKMEGANPQAIVCSTTNCSKTNQFLDVEIGNSSNAFNLTSSEINVMVLR